MAFRQGVRGIKGGSRLNGARGDHLDTIHATIKWRLFTSAKTALRTDEGTEVHPRRSLIPSVQGVGSLRQRRTWRGKTPIDKFGHEVEGTVFGFGTACTRGEGRAKGV